MRAFYPQSGTFAARSIGIYISFDLWVNTVKLVRIVKMIRESVRTSSYSTEPQNPVHGTSSLWKRIFDIQGSFDHNEFGGVRMDSILWGRHVTSRTLGVVGARRVTFDLRNICSFWDGHSYWLHDGSHHNIDLH